MLTSLTTADLVIVIGALLLSVGFHEATHAFVAHWLGDTTARDLGRLSLNPLKHIDLFTTLLIPIILIFAGLPPFFAAKPVPLNPDRVKYDEFGLALIGVAGPLSNLLLATAAGGLIRILGVNGSLELSRVLLIFIQVNIGLFVFNMIPFPPLDGSRLLYAFAPRGLQELMYKIESAGFIAIFIFIIILLQVPALTDILSAINNNLFHILVG